MVPHGAVTDERRVIIEAPKATDSTKTNLQLLIGKSKKNYLGLRDTQKWMQNHKYSDESIKREIKSLVIGKTFFHIVDTDMNLSISMAELHTGLVSLGVTVDSAFLRKVVQILITHGKTKID